MQPPTLMSKTAKSKNRGAGQRFGRLNATGLGNHSMSKLFEHFDNHHPYQGLVFNQKYGQALHLALTLSNGIQKLRDPR